MTHDVSDPVHVSQRLEALERLRHDTETVAQDRRWSRTHSERIMVLCHGSNLSPADQPLNPLPEVSCPTCSPNHVEVISLTASAEAHDQERIDEMEP